MHAAGRAPHKARRPFPRTLSLAARSRPWPRRARPPARPRCVAPRAPRARSRRPPREPPLPRNPVGSGARRALACPLLARARPCPHSVWSRQARVSPARARQTLPPRPGGSGGGPPPPLPPPARRRPRRSCASNRPGARAGEASASPARPPARRPADSPGRPILGASTRAQPRPPRAPARARAPAPAARQTLPTRRRRLRPAAARRPRPSAGGGALLARASRRRARRRLPRPGAPLPPPRPPQGGRARAPCNLLLFRPGGFLDGRERLGGWRPPGRYSRKGGPRGARGTQVNWGQGAPGAAAAPGRPPEWRQAGARAEGRHQH
jgi:hypothetical protein